MIFFISELSVDAMDRHVQVNLMENNDHQSIDVIQNQDTDQMTETNNTFQTKPGKDKIQGTTLSFYLILISVLFIKKLSLD